MIYTTELRLHCPDIHTQRDESAIRGALVNSPGIDLIEVDHRTGEVRIITSNQDEGLDARRRVADAGFPPDRVTTRAIARPEQAEQA